MLTPALHACAVAGSEAQGRERAVAQPQADVLHARDAVRSPTPRPARASPPCTAPEALTTVERAPFAAPTSSRSPRSSPRRRGRLARRCEAGPGRGQPAALGAESASASSSPYSPTPPVQVDAEEWAQVPEDQEIADISRVQTVRAAFTRPHGVCPAQPRPHPRVCSRMRTSWSGCVACQCPSSAWRASCWSKAA